MTANRLTDAANLRAFALAGNATLTFVSVPTGARFTYQVRRAKGEDTKRPWFVSVLTGPNNTEDFTYLGCIFEGSRFRHTAKSTIAPSAPSARAFSWAWGKSQGEDLPDELEAWHEGRCGACGRALTVPSSIETGIGPVCAGKAAA